MAEPKIRLLADFLEAEVGQVELILDPWLPTHGLAMIAGPRGGGKTMLGMATAIAIAGGGQVMGWSAPQPRRVLYIDGEMSIAEMQTRAATLIEGVECNRDAALRNLVFYCDADQENGIKNLIQHASSRAQIEHILLTYDIEVVYLDNLSALCNSEAENDTESWTVMQDWLRKLRREGYSCVFLHHTGKMDNTGNYKQRGTSKREDILNTSMILKPEGDHGFEIEFTKHRGFTPQRELHARMVFEPGVTRILTVEQFKRQNIDMAKLAKELG